MPASAVTGFHVEPGGYRPAIARLSPGVFARFAAASSRSGASFFGFPRPTKIDGL